MYKKNISQFILFVSIFFFLWFGLSQINYLGNEKIKELSSQNEESLSKLFIKQLLHTNSELKNDSIVNVVKFLKDHILIKNSLDSADITLFVIENDEINAYAFPGRNIIVHSALIRYCKSPEELCAVLAHEIAHIEQDHVMKKLTKEIGIGILAALLSGNNGEMISEIIQTISSNYYSRDLENEADELAIEYLANANINPSSLANFLFRFSQDYYDLPKELEWVSSHPVAKERAANILETSNQINFEEKGILNEDTWNYIQMNLENQ